VTGLLARRLLAGAALGLLAAGLLPAEGARGAEPEPAPPTPAQREGARLFREAVAWVSKGRAHTGALRTVFADLEDVMVEHDGHRRTGDLRVWYQAPDKMRWQQRRGVGFSTIIKVRDGGALWIYDRDPATRREQWRRIHGSSGAGPALEQAERDMGLVVDLARFLSLTGLAGDGVTFESKGLSQFPEGHHLAGRWWKVQRRAPDGERLALLLAFERGADGTVHATHPGAILVPPASAGDPIEHYVLGRWVRGPDGARPRRVRRWTKKPGDETFVDTIRARLERFLVDVPFPAARFRSGGGPEKGP
jgi:hypothetical protein